MAEKNLLRAFTLVEVLIAITIFSLVVIAIFSLYLSGVGFYRRGTTRSELLQNGRVILERMSREIRQAREIVTELSETESGATSTILFEDGHISPNYHYIHYFQEGDLIKREVIGYYFSDDQSQTLVPWDSTPPSGQALETVVLEEAKIIGEHLQDLKIWGSDLVNISLTLTENGETIELKTKIFGRNL